MYLLLILVGLGVILLLFLTCGRKVSAANSASILRPSAVGYESQSNDVGLGLDSSDPAPDPALIAMRDAITPSRLPQILDQVAYLFAASAAHNQFLRSGFPPGLGLEDKTEENIPLGIMVALGMHLSRMGIATNDQHLAAVSRVYAAYQPVHDRIYGTEVSNVNEAVQLARIIRPAALYLSIRGEVFGSADVVKFIHNDFRN